MSVRTVSIRSILTLFLFGLLPAASGLKAQPPSLTPRFSPALDYNINGFWEYLPRNYAAAGSQTYPLLIFFHGLGDSGGVPDLLTLNKVLNAGTPKILKNGSFPDSFYVGNKWFKFIVLSPQIINGFGTTSSIVQPATIQAVIDYATTAYRVDSTRIYLGGLSMGGGAVWDYAGSSAAAARKLAAISVAAGAADLTTQEAGNIAAANLPVIATHNTVDDVVQVGRTRANIQLIKSYSPASTPQPLAIYWDIPGQDTVKHNVWGRTYESLGIGTTPGGSLNDTMGVNVYEWMLQYSRSQSLLPLVWKSFTAATKNNAVVLTWRIAGQKNIQRYEAEKSLDGHAWSLFATAPARQGADAVVTYTLTDSHPYAGITYYRIRQVDLDGSYSYSLIEKAVPADNGAGSMKIYPSPFSDKINISFYNEGRTSIDVLLSNAAGAAVKQQHVNLAGSSGNENTSLSNLQGLPPGVYYIRVTDSAGKTLARKKMIK